MAELGKAPSGGAGRGRGKGRTGNAGACVCLFFRRHPVLGALACAALVACVCFSIFAIAVFSDFSQTAELVYARF